MTLQTELNSLRKILENLERNNLTKTKEYEMYSDQYQSIALSLVEEGILGDLGDD